MNTRRWFRFYAVGAAGILVQAGVFAALMPLLGAHYLVATGIAVEAAVLHNFFWHQRWTWADRPDSGSMRRLLRFNFTTGLTSIVANVILMRILVGLFHLDPLSANLLTIAACSVINFVISDHLVFTPSQPGCGPPTRPSLPPAG